MNTTEEQIEALERELVALVKRFPDVSGRDYQRVALNMAWEIFEPDDLDVLMTSREVSGLISKPKNLTVLLQLAEENQKKVDEVIRRVSEMLEGFCA